MTDRKSSWMFSVMIYCSLREGIEKIVNCRFVSWRVKS